ncbi:sigma-70 family RNA polymerase sigma factor [Aggregicoccus sp. 17bor-14]|uniref:RNA polymerase sigma factor n=1 Tax=Myxococcaceae TaxID=31 RepID=UPI00129C72F1|nr:MULTISPECIES: sigma-70 family RNA polymerase sigma factor [Myxococcaceae]MBF5042535.1 sigma-70 family RNA polymerase sigma factor [Simulacricoccus sp. 17bor-14]MRI88305.1 sigma-70 family RNA polymerase sigma factor [Aggregicoccus sp. 17bor-14]
MPKPRPARPLPPAPPRFLAWLSELVHAQRARLVRQVRREGLSAEDALECVQEAFSSFLTLPQARQLVEVPEDAAKLLSVLARNLARNRRRLHAVARTHAPAELAALPSEGPSVDALIAAAEAHAAAVGCVAHLGEVQRRVVTLRLLDEVPGEDVARLLGTSAGNVAVLLHRAKGQLRTCMASAGYREA